MNASPRYTAGSPRLRYWVEGEGPPVLLVMGFGMRGEIWRPQIDHLKRKHQVAFYDARGIGDSEHGWATSMHTHADDALRVLDALGWARAHLVGVSMGGMVAQHLALRASPRFLTLSLIATHSGGPTAVIPTARGLRLFLRVNTSSGADRIRALSHLLYPESFADGAADAVGDRVREIAGVRAPLKTVVAQLVSVMRHDTRRDLRRLAIPTLVIKPEQDILVRPQHNERLARLIPDAELVSFAEAGHGIIHQCAEQVAARLTAHFARPT